MMICFSGSSRASLSGRMGRSGGGDGGERRASGRPGRAEAEREVGRGDPGPLAEGDAALDDALQLADVARPVVAAEEVERVGREAGDGLGELARRTAAAEMIGEALDVAAAVAEGRQPEADDADPVVEVAAEPALLDERRRGSRASASTSRTSARTGSIAADGLEFAVLEERGGAAAGAPA